MSKTIDEKVVSMQFDNSNFEKNVSTTMSTIDKLKEKLKFTGATKGLDEIEKASNRIDFKGVGSGLNSITSKLDLANVFAYRLASTISDSLLGAINSIVSAATSLEYLNPTNITAGWSKFEEQTKSVQTILSAVSQKINEETGELYNTDDVYETINKLSWYADETSYNMEQMTSAIASFTSTGMDLKDAEQMIIGISNACALAGVDATHAEHAFSGLSKSVGQGYVTLSVWNNQLKTSGLSANEEFKQSLLDAGVAMGYLEKQADGLYNIIYEGSDYNGDPFGIGALETTLTEGKWLTTDVLQSAFETYTGELNNIFAAYEEGGTTTSAIISDLVQQFNDAGEAIPKWLRAFQAAQEAVTFTQAIESATTAVQSVWANVFNVMFGDIDQQKKTWTQLANDLYSVFAEPAWAFADVVTEAFGVIDEANPDVTGTTLLAESMHNLLQIVINLQNIVGKAWNEVFPPEKRAKALQNLIVKIHDLTSSMASSTTESKLFSSILKTIFTFIKMVGEVVSQLAKGALSILKNVLKGLNISTGDFGDKVSDAATNLADWIAENKTFQKTLEKLGGVLGDVIKNVREWIEKFMELPVVQKIIEGFSDAVGNIKDVVLDVFENGIDIDSIKQKFSELTASIPENSSSNPFSTFAAILGKAFGKVSTDVSDFVAKIKTKFSEVLDGSSDTSKEIQDILNKLISACETLIGFWIGYKIVTGLGDLAGALQKLVSPLTAVSTLTEALASAPKAIAGYFNALTKNIKTNYIIKIAAALTILSIAFFIMAKIDWQKLVVGAGVLVAMGIALTIMAKALATLDTKDQSKKLEAFANMMLKVSAAILLIAVGFKMLDSISIDSVSNITIILALGMLAIAAAARIMSNKTIVVSIQTSAKTLIAFSASLLILVAAIRAIDSLNLKHPVKTLATLAGLMISLAGVTWAISKIKFSNKGTFKVLTIAGALYIMVLTINKLSELPAETIYAGILKLLPILVGLETLFGLSGKVGAKAGSVGIYLLSLSAGILLLSFAIKRLANMNVGDIVKGGIACTAIMGVMALIGKLMTFGDGKGFASLRQSAGISMLILSLSAAMVLIVGMILILKNIDAKDLRKAGITIGLLMLCFGGMFALMNLTGSISSFSGNVKAVAALSAMAVVLGVMTVCVLLISTIPSTTNLIATVAGLTGIFISLSLLMGVLGLCPTKGVLVGIIAIAAILAEVTAVILIIYKLGGSAEETLTICEALSLLFISLAASMTLISIAGSLATIALPGLKALAIGIAAISGIIVALQWLLHNDIIGTDLSQVTEFLTNLGGAIGGFIGGLIGNAGATMLDTLGPSLKSFGENLKSFLSDYSEGVAKLPADGNTKAFDVITEVIKTFASPTIYNGIKRLGEGAKNGDLESLGTFMDQYADIVIGLSNKLKENTFSSSRVQAAASAGQMIAALYESIPSSGGFFSLFTGEKSLKDFGAEMEDYAQSLVNVCLTLATSSYFSQETVEKAANAGMVMSELANAIPDQGTSLMSMLTGTQDLSVFGDQIKAYIESLVTGCKAITEAGEETDLNDAATKATSIGEIFRSFAETVPEMTSLKSLILGGDHNLGNFGDGIASFAKGIADMSIMIAGGTASDGTVYAGVDEDACTKASSIGRLFTALAEAIPESGGLRGLLMGGATDLGTFSEQLRRFAPALVSFVNTINGVTSWPSDDTLASVTSCTSELVTLAQTVSNVEIGNGMSLTELGDQIRSFGQSMKNFSDAIVNFDGTNVDAIISAIKQLYNSIIGNATSATEGASLGADNTANAYSTQFITNTSMGILPKIKALFQTEVPTSMDASEGAITAANNATEAYTGEILSEETTTSVVEAASEFANKGAEAADQSSSYRTSAANAIGGFIGKIKESVDLNEPYNALYSFGKNGLAGLNAALDEHSPSKETAKSAKFAVLGFTNTIRDNLSRSEKSGTDLGSSVLNGLATAISLADSIVDTDLQPVITPVLDLSQVQSGIGGIDNMIGANRSLSLAASVPGQNRAQLATAGVSPTININFSVSNAGRDLSSSDIQKYGRMIADEVNQRLGLLL